MRILIGCEFSGTVRRAMRDAGHDAWSCDLLPSTDASPHHLQGDVFKAVDEGGWDMAIFHPPCTYLSSSGLHWNKRVAGRAERTEEALVFVRRLLELPIPKIALENPIGCISTRIRPFTQRLQPYEYGNDASKSTCIWLKGLPKLTPTLRIPGRKVEWPAGSGKIVERWANQTDSGQNKLAPSEDRWAERSITYPGIARAMAEQWLG